jgi:hypothetical protein
MVSQCRMLWESQRQWSKEMIPISKCKVFLFWPCFRNKWWNYGRCSSMILFHFFSLTQMWGNSVLFSSEEANSSSWCGFPGRACGSCVYHGAENINQECADRLMVPKLATKISRLGKYVAAEWPNSMYLTHLTDLAHCKLRIVFGQRTTLLQSPFQILTFCLRWIWIFLPD